MERREKIYKCVHIYQLALVNEFKWAFVVSLFFGHPNTNWYFWNNNNFVVQINISVYIPKSAEHSGSNNMLPMSSFVLIRTSLSRQILISNGKATDWNHIVSAVAKFSCMKTLIPFHPARFPLYALQYRCQYMNWKHFLHHWPFVRGIYSIVCSTASAN